MEDRPAARPTPIRQRTSSAEKERPTGATPIRHHAKRGGGAERSEAEGGIKSSKSRRKAGTTERARKFRWVENEAEGLLWQELKGKRLGGFHFTRQLPVGPYFADFCCRRSKLVVEIDGSQHADSQYDRRRDDFMRSQGLSVLRVWNVDVLKHRASVCETILAALDGRMAEDVIATDLRFASRATTVRLTNKTPDSTPDQRDISP